MNKFFSLSLVLALSVAPCFGVQKATVKAQEVKVVAPAPEVQAPAVEEAAAVTPEVKEVENAATKVDEPAQIEQAVIATPTEEIKIEEVIAPAEPATIPAEEAVQN